MIDSMDAPRPLEGASGAATCGGGGSPVAASVAACRRIGGEIPAGWGTESRGGRWKERGKEKWWVPFRPESESSFWFKPLVLFFIYFFGFKLATGTPAFVSRLY
jgi:hypothetical protein